jgi:hypothetical protein
MLTKEKWLEVRTQGFIPLEVCFEFYKERGGTLTDIMEFGRIFSDLISTGQLISSPTGIKRVTNDSARNSIHSYYNTKFGV